MFGERGKEWDLHFPVRGLAPALDRGKLCRHARFQEHESGTGQARTPIHHKHQAAPQGTANCDVYQSKPENTQTHTPEIRCGVSGYVQHTDAHSVATGESSGELQRLDSSLRGILVQQLIATVQLTETLKVRQPAPRFC